MILRPPTPQPNGSEPFPVAIPVEPPPLAILGATEREIPVADIDPDPENARKYFDEEGIQGLAENIAEHGLLNAITVYRDPVSGRYRLVGGERRWRAHLILGRTTIRARALEEQPDQAKRCELALLDNESEEISDIERGLAYQRYLTTHGCTASFLAKRLGRHVSSITRCCKRSQQLPPDLQERVACRTLPPAVAQVLLGLPVEEMRKIASLYPSTLKSRTEVLAAVRAVKSGSSVESPAGFTCEELGIRITVTLPPGRKLADAATALRLVVKGLLGQNGGSVADFKEFLAKKALAARKAAELEAAQNALSGHRKAHPDSANGNGQ